MFFLCVSFQRGKELEGKSHVRNAEFFGTRGAKNEVHFFEPDTNTVPLIFLLSLSIHGGENFDW